MYSGDLKSIVPTKVDLDARLPELINYMNVFRCPEVNVPTKVDLDARLPELINYLNVFR